MSREIEGVALGRSIRSRGRARLNAALAHAFDHLLAVFHSIRSFWKSPPAMWMLGCRCSASGAEAGRLVADREAAFFALTLRLGDQ